MTTQPKASTLPSYKFLILSETAGVGYVATSNGFLTSNDAWAYKPGSVSPYNAAPINAVPPQAFSIQGQNATSSFASAGGDINLNPGAGSVSNVSGNVVIKDRAGNGGTWNTSHPVLGIYHLWVDSSGRLRIKGSAPSSDTDGAVVGTQT